jgi:hypothetical protein
MSRSQRNGFAGKGSVFASWIGTFTTATAPNEFFWLGPTSFSFRSIQTVGATVNVPTAKRGHVGGLRARHQDRDPAGRAAIPSRKIREAQTGRIPVGPRKNAHREDVTFKVLPLRMESRMVDTLDEAWRSRGIKNRMEFFRGALGHHLKLIGAELLGAAFTSFSVEHLDTTSSNLVPMMRRRCLPMLLRERECRPRAGAGSNRQVFGMLGQSASPSLAPRWAPQLLFP